MLMWGTVGVATLSSMIFDRGRKIYFKLRLVFIFNSNFIFMSTHQTHIQTAFFPIVRGTHALLQAD